VESFSANRNAKRCFLQNQFHDTQKAEAFLNTEEYVLSQTTIVGQATGGFGASQATAYKAECKNDRTERTN
jgi:hypothetical protein